MKRLIVTLGVFAGCNGNSNAYDAVREQAPANASCVTDLERREAVCFTLDGAVTRCTITLSDASRYEARCAPAGRIVVTPELDAR